MRKKVFSNFPIEEHCFEVSQKQPSVNLQEFTHFCALRGSPTWSVPGWLTILRKLEFY